MRWRWSSPSRSIPASCRVLHPSLRRRRPPPRPPETPPAPPHTPPPPPRPPPPPPEAGPAPAAPTAAPAPEGPVTASRYLTAAIAGAAVSGPAPTLMPGVAVEVQAGLEQGTI